MFSIAWYIALHQYELLEVIIQTRVTVMGSGYKKARQIHHLLSQVLSGILRSCRICWQVTARSPSNVLRWSWQFFCVSRQPWLVWAWLLHTIVVELKIRSVLSWTEICVSTSTGGGSLGIGYTSGVRGWSVGIHLQCHVRCEWREARHSLLPDTWSYSNHRHCYDKLSNCRAPLAQLPTTALGLPATELSYFHPAKHSASFQQRESGIEYLCKFFRWKGFYPISRTTLPRPNVQQ